jgi:hypothetical protein
VHCHRNPVIHIGKDTLVGWAWKPGFGRAPVPGTQEQAGALVEARVKTGGGVPRPLGRALINSIWMDGCSTLASRHGWPALTSRLRAPRS